MSRSASGCACPRKRRAACASPASSIASAISSTRSGLYVFTINGFPYGPFHGQPVKAAVYRPDWREAERGRYTADLAELAGCASARRA